MTCPLCVPVAETVLWQDEACRVIAVDEPSFPGFCRVVWSAHVAEMSDLLPAEHMHLLAVVLATEKAQGLLELDTYRAVQIHADRIKNDLLAYLIEQRRAGRRIAAYGAAAKGNTLLNFAGVRSELIACVADRNPAKQGKRLPGSRIPIVDEAALEALQPDYVVILPWNIRAEVVGQLAGLSARGTRFVTAIPRLKVA